MSTFSNLRPKSEPVSVDDWGTHQQHNQKYGFVFYAGDSFNQLTYTIAHELGHGTFGLIHPWQDPLVLDNPLNTLGDYFQGSDPFNLMEWTSFAKFLKKYQWDIIQD